MTLNQNDEYMSAADNKGPDAAENKVKLYESISDSAAEKSKEALEILRDASAQLELNRNLAGNLIIRTIEISNSLPYRIAHFMTEIKHMLFGNKEDRKSGRRWLFKDRKHITKYNYANEIMRELEKIKLNDTVSHEYVGGAAGYVKQSEDLNCSIKLNETFEEIIKGYGGKYIFILPELLDWHAPLFQRPEQIALALARQGYLFFYVTTNYIDKIDQYEILEDNCVLITDSILPIVKSIAEKYGKHIVLDIYSTDQRHFDEWLGSWNDCDRTILYEYIDEISPDITTFVSEEMMDRHVKCLEDESVCVVATADKLYNDVAAYRKTGKNALKSGNGVDVDHFKVEPDVEKVPDGLKAAVLSGKPVIGYYGAIANWLDFEMVLQAANERPDYYFVLIGPHYGDHDLPVIDKILKKENIIWENPINYHDLPFVANFFTVSTIPFKINEITESTSPLKLFEYMAMGTPIVTTAMKECMKHPEVMIAHDGNEFIDLIDKAVAITRSADYDDYKARLFEAAYGNSWAIKAKEIVELIENRSL